MDPTLGPTFCAGVEDQIQPMWSAAKLVHDNTVPQGGDFGNVPWDFRTWSDNLWHIYDDTVPSLKRDCESAWPALLESPSDNDLWILKRSVASRRPMFVVPISYFRDCSNDPAVTAALRRTAEEAWVGCSSIHAELAVFDAWVGRLIAWRRRQGLV